MGMSKARKRAIYGGAAAVVLAGAAWGVSALYGSSADLPDSRLAAVERGVIVRSVVATGKIEPITKVEIKSKANGIIKFLPVEVDQEVEAGTVLVELDRENLMARVREARATLQGSKAAHLGAEANFEKSRVEAEGPEVEFARRSYDRAKSLYEQKLIAQHELENSRTQLDQAENKRRAAESQLSVAKARVSEASAN